MKSEKEMTALGDIIEKALSETGINNPKFMAFVDLPENQLLALGNIQPDKMKDLLFLMLKNMDPRFRRIAESGGMSGVPSEMIKLLSDLFVSALKSLLVDLQELPESSDIDLLIANLSVNIQNIELKAEEILS